MFGEKHRFCRLEGGISKPVSEAMVWLVASTRQVRTRQVTCLSLAARPNNGARFPRVWFGYVWVAGFGYDMFGLGFG